MGPNTEGSHPGYHHHVQIDGNVHFKPAQQGGGILVADRADIVKLIDGVYDAGGANVAAIIVAQRNCQNGKA